MKRSRRFLWLFVCLILVAIGGVWYWRADQAFQDSYRTRVSGDIAKLIQTNPYDQVSVVVIVIDGLRWTEGIGAQDKYLPHIWNDLRPMGTLLTNYRIASPTVTTSVHTALVSGRVCEEPNDGHIRSVFPTMQEYYRDARSDYVKTSIENIVQYPGWLFRPDSESTDSVGKLEADAEKFGPNKTPLYLGKDLIFCLNRSSSGRYPGDDVLLADSMVDQEVEELFQAKLPDVKPNMVFVNLPDVDECGHEAQWFYYVDAIRNADKHVWNMWQTVQSLSKYRGKTYFIITTDHGRHEPDRGGFPHHGCFCDGCQHSFMLLIGPNIKQDFVSDQPHSEVDLAPTVGAVTGVSIPGSTGQPIMEAIEDPSKLPQPRVTPLTKTVAEDKIKEDSRDTGKVLLESILDKAPKESWGNNSATEMMLLAVAARIEAHPDEAESWLLKLPQSVDSYETSVAKLSDLRLAYPFLVLGRANENSGSKVCYGFTQKAQEMFKNARDKGLIQNWDVGSSPAMDDMEQVAWLAALDASFGKSEQDYNLTRDAYALMLDTFGRLEGAEKALTPGLEGFIDTYKYREGPNEIFTKKQITMRDRMWLMWGAERVLAESDATHVQFLHPLLERQYRLLAAFCNEWQDANAMVGGKGDLSEDVDIPAQGLSLASMAEFKPWRKWELDELGYSKTIYATPIFDFPARHFFYILGMADALAGSWTADERMRLFVNDDGSLRRDLLDKTPPYQPSDADYPFLASSLAYGLERFEKADYNQFDLELYPIVHQQETTPAQ